MHMERIMNAGTGHLQSPRVDWVDVAKGFCIVFVVMMHSTLGVGHAAGGTGWMHELVEFARPFRMPDFFMISGLFLANVIDRDWRRFLDRKFVHFAYFYVLWVGINFAFRAPSMLELGGPRLVIHEFLLAFVEPFGTLWFIYMLPIFFVLTKLLRRVPAWVVLLVAGVLESAPIHTGHLIIDEFCDRFVYFYAGYVGAKIVFDLASTVRANPALGGGWMVAWMVVNGVFVFTGSATLPGVSLVLGFLGAAAVVNASALLTMTPAAKVLRYLGENSIVIYLGFFLGMVPARILLLKSGLIDDIGTISLLVTLVAILVPVLLHRLVKDTGLRFLFSRPAVFHLEQPHPRAQVMPAE